MPRLLGGRAAGGAPYGWPRVSEADNFLDGRGKGGGPFAEDGEGRSPTAEEEARTRPAGSSCCEGCTRDGCT